MRLGFGYGWFSPKVGQNAMLDRLWAEVKRHRFETVLARLWPDGGAGRPPYAPVVMLKALLVQQW